MSSLDVNKFVGAVLLSALTLMVIGVIGNVLVHPDEHATAVVAEAEHAPAAAAPKAPAAIEPIGPLLASADVGKGEKIFKKCHACHSSEKGAKPKVGPNLWNVVNAERGHQTDFKYSDALKAKEGKWTYESLNAFLTKPKDYIKGTKMAFSGIKKAQDRADVIAYLRTLSDSPAPLP